MFQAKKSMSMFSTGWVFYVLLSQPIVGKQVCKGVDANIFYLPLLVEKIKEKRPKGRIP